MWSQGRAEGESLDSKCPKFPFWHDVLEELQREPLGPGKLGHPTFPGPKESSLSKQSLRGVGAEDRTSQAHFSLRLRTEALGGQS